MKINAWILWMCMSLPAVAATPPPEREPFHDSHWTARSTAKPAPAFQMGTFIGRFEETTLADIMKRAGAGIIEHQGDAGESLYWLCYTIGDSQRVWITAHGEMGGPSHQITEIRAQMSPVARPTTECPSLPKSLRPISMQRDLWLGAAEPKVLNTLGEPSHSEGNWRMFYYRTKVPGRCEPDGFDLGNWLLMKFMNGRADTLIAGQITSC